MYHRLDTKTVNLHPHAARWWICGFRGIWGEKELWELGRSAMYLDCYQLLINVYHCFIMMNLIYPYHIPPWFVDSW